MSYRHVGENPELDRPSSTPAKRLWPGIAVGLGALIFAACSSDFAPAAGDDPDDPDTVDGGSTITQGADASSDVTPPTQTEDGGLQYDAQEGPEDAGPTLVCAKNAVVFDLTGLAPDSNMPDAFVDAWDYEVGNPVDSTKGAALVLAATGLASGPINVRIGGTVHQSGNFLVPLAGAGAATVNVTVDPVAKHNLVRTRLPANFNVTVGPLDNRRAFAVTAVSFTFEVDEDCNELNGTLRLEVPGAGNETLPFGNGGTTFGSVLGDYDLDTDNDTVADGWALTFDSSRGSVNAHDGLVP